MTKAEFFAELRRESRPGDWRVIYNDHVRSTDDSLPSCPICWLASRKGANPLGYHEAFTRVYGALGLSANDAYDIARAADRCGTRADAQLLADACHLDPEEVV